MKKKLSVTVEKEIIFPTREENRWKNLSEYESCY